MFSADRLVSKLYEWFRDVPQGTVSDDTYEFHALMYLAHLLHEDYRKLSAANAAKSQYTTYDFISPPTPKKIAYAVSAPHFDAFLKEFGLDREAMVKVANGEVFEHKGWIRGLRMGGTWIGMPYKAPRKEQDEKMQKAKKEAEADRKRLAKVKPYEAPAPPESVTYRPE